MTTKANIIDEVAAKTGLKKKDADSAVNAVFDIIQNNLISGDKVQIVGFGTFESRERGPRKGRNPHTGNEIDISASKHIAFNAGKALKDSLNK